MAAKQKHRIAGNPYNLRKKVEIPVEIQLEDDSAYLNKFASQPTPGQVFGSKTGSDTDSTSTGVDKKGTDPKFKSRGGGGKVCRYLCQRRVNGPINLS